MTAMFNPVVQTMPMTINDPSGLKLTLSTEELSEEE
jgi:hypothetical protein